MKHEVFQIITKELRELGEVCWCREQSPLSSAVSIQATDFEYAENLKFSENVVQKAMDAIRERAWIVTDTQMGKSGINKKKLAQYGGEVCCFMSDEETAKLAKENGTTRAIASMERAAQLDKKLIFAIGNAPTALVRLYEMIREGRLEPELIIGVPVGFVNVVQSKELILSLEETPYIVARGEKAEVTLQPVSAMHFCI